MDGHNDAIALPRVECLTYFERSNRAMQLIWTTIRNGWSQRRNRLALNVSRTLNTATEQCNRFEGFASNVDLYRMLTTTMQSPRLKDLTDYLTYFERSNRTMQSIWRYPFERRFVPNAHNNDAAALPQMPRFVDWWEYVQDGTLSCNNNRRMQLIRRYRFERRFVLDGHMTMQLPHECLALLIVDTYRMVPYHTTTEQLRAKNEVWTENHDMRLHFWRINQSANNMYLNCTMLPVLVHAAQSLCYKKVWP
jgi:uncharacterized protein Usg